MSDCIIDLSSLISPVGEMCLQTQVTFYILIAFEVKVHVVFAVNM